MASSSVQHDAEEERRHPPRARPGRPRARDPLGDRLTPWAHAVVPETATTTTLTIKVVPYVPLQAAVHRKDVPDAGHDQHPVGGPSDPGEAPRLAAPAAPTGHRPEARDEPGERELTPDLHRRRQNVQEQSDRLRRDVEHGPVSLAEPAELHFL